MKKKNVAETNGQYHVQLEDIGPEEAIRILETNKENRDLSDRHACALADEMSAGKWMDGFSTIVIDRDGNLRDGQHRLWAIVESGTRHKFWVIRGVDPKCQLVIDTGLKRTAADSIRLAYPGTSIDRRDLEIAKAFYTFPVFSKYAWTTSVLFECAKKIREGLQFTAQHFPRERRYSPAPVAAVVTRAFYNDVDENKLIRFCSVLLTGEMLRASERVIIRLRDWLAEEGVSRHGVGHRMGHYLRTQAALHHYLKGTQVKQLKEISEDLYPIPPEKQVEIPLAVQGRRQKFRGKQEQILIGREAKTA